MSSAFLLEAIAVTFELCGGGMRVLTPGAAKVFSEDLTGYDERQVFDSLCRCRKEVRGALTVSDVVSRLDDGRPSPDEAWSFVSGLDERRTIVWTREMCDAWTVASHIHNDRVAARLAFVAAYKERVGKARDRREPVQWTASLGHDAGGAEPVLRAAIECGRLTVADTPPHLAIAAPIVERTIAPLLQRVIAAPTGKVPS